MPRQHRNQAGSFRPSVEFLERRCVPTTITPTTFADGGLGSGSLRDAVLQFNADTGTEDDTIQLQAGATFTWHETVAGTPNPAFRRIEITVVDRARPDYVLARLVGYLGQLAQQ